MVVTCIFNILFIIYMLFLYFTYIYIYIILLFCVIILCKVIILHLFSVSYWCRTLVSWGVNLFTELFQIFTERNLRETRRVEAGLRA